MDFSSLNPITSNVLNLAARENNVRSVRRFLKKINPNCIDNRGWTCLHEAAAHDSYDSLIYILKHPECRPLAESHEGHTALYVACREEVSQKTIEALLESYYDIANFGSTERVTPLHVVSAQGRIDIILLLIQYGAIIDVQDLDGDTPLHDAVDHPEAVAVLLHAGADPEIENDARCTPFHMACLKGCLETVQLLYPFLIDINQLTIHNDSPLILATSGCCEKVVDFLLKHGADPHSINIAGDSALDIALNNGYSALFFSLLTVTDRKKIKKDIILCACKPHYFKFESLEYLLNYYNIGPEFFDFIEPFHITLEKIGDIQPTYTTNAPLNSYLNICEYIYCQSPERFKEFFYLFLMRGVGVDSINIQECPPLVYIHYCAHTMCFQDVFTILREHGCNVDYCSRSTPSVCMPSHCAKVPDAFIASLTANPSTSPIMLQYSLQCEPQFLLNFAYEYGVLGRIPPEVQTDLLSLIGLDEEISVQSLPYVVLSLKHLCRMEVRSVLRRNGVSTSEQFLRVICSLQIPQLLKNYLRYL